MNREPGLEITSNMQKRDKIVKVMGGSMSRLGFSEELHPQSEMGP
jgi:hypothetical protein